MISRPLSRPPHPRRGQHPPAIHSLLRSPASPIHSPSSLLSFSQVIHIFSIPVVHGLWAYSLAESYAASAARHPKGSLAVALPVFTPLCRWRPRTLLPSLALLQALCPPLASAVRTTLATATAGLHHCACLPGGCSFKTRLSSCLSGIRFVSCLSIRGIDFWAAFAVLIAVWAWQHWDVGATSANVNPVVVRAWTVFLWHCRKWRFGAPENSGNRWRGKQGERSIPTSASEAPQGKGAM